MNPLKPRMTQPTEIDYESKQKYFAHLPASVVKATFKHTTQNMRLPPSSYLHKMFTSPNPSANLKRHKEVDGKLSRDTLIASWIAAAALRTFGF